MNDPNFLAPPSSSTTKTTMNISPNSDASVSSGQNSPDSSRSRSPLASFDIPLDPSDPLSFLMDPHSGDSSTEESYMATNTPPSSHNSPSGDWSVKDATMDWPESQFTYPYHGSDPSVNALNSGEFDASFFVEETLALWMDPNNIPQAPDLSSFGFTFDANAFNDLQVPESTDSSGASSIASASSSPAMARAQVSQNSTQLPSVAAVRPTQSAQPMGMPKGEPQMSGNQLLDELTRLAKQTAGVSVALPIGMEIPDASNGQGRKSHIVFRSAHSNNKPSLEAKLPIPRLQRPTPVPSASSPTDRRRSSASSSSSEASPQAQSDASGSPPPPPVPGRTKTSHTTIERRYRTNLNARIQSLRAAVPALRVLEIKPGNRVGNLAIKAGTRRAGVNVEPGLEEEDVIDERGYIDGVKVARKGSKANVLGKATEYIRVLKRREHRLKREQDGLRTLIKSLVGGPALLKEWESVWRERFGGPEKDEVEGEDGEADDENDDEDEDADEDLDEDGSAAGKKRKRTKVDSKKKGAQATSVSQAQTTSAPQAHSFAMASASGPMSGPPGAPEKRKRGRPRKNPLPSSAPVAGTGGIQDVFSMQHIIPTANIQMEIDTQSQQSTTTPQQPQMIVQQQAQPGQYLLAAFAFFSFFNGPPSFYKSSDGSDYKRPGPHEYTHSGTVLGSHHDTGVWHETTSTRTSSWGWHDAVQILHISVSFLLLLSIITPWLPRFLQGRIFHLVPRALKPLLGSSFVSYSESRGGRNGRLAPPSSAGPISDDENTSDEEKADSYARMVLLAAIHDGRHSSPFQEAQMLREALGLGSGSFGLLLSLSRFVGSSRKSSSRFGLERRMLEQKAAIRLAELAALDSMLFNTFLASICSPLLVASTTIADRIQVYLFAFKFLSTFTASASDLATLALVVKPFWRTKAVSLWSLALNRAQGKGSLRPQISKAHETFILESMSVDDAVKAIVKLDYANSAQSYQSPSTAEDSDSDSGSCDSDDLYETSSPLAILAIRIVRDYVRNHAERVFLQTVSGEVLIGERTGEGEQQDNEYDLARIVSAGRTLDPQTSLLVELLDRVCNPTSLHLAHPSSIQDVTDPDEELNNACDAEANHISALLHAILLYRQIFPSTLLSIPSRGDDDCKAASTSSISISLTPMPSPPPTPSRRNMALHLLLRSHLYSPAFNRLDELEDARDRVVDSLSPESVSLPKRLHF